MTVKEYYEILKQEWERVDKNNLEAIKRYNRMKQALREEIEE